MVQVICRVHRILFGSTNFELDGIVLAPSSSSVLCKYSVEVKTTRFSLGIIQWKHSSILITPFLLKKKKYYFIKFLSLQHYIRSMI